MTCIVGKGGLADGVLESISAALGGRELVKIRLPAGSGGDRQELAIQIAETLEAECVGVLGRTALLYRPAEQLSADDRIQLPEEPS